MRATVPAFWATGDAVSIGVIGGTLLNYLPPAAAFFAIAWYVIQMYESKTIQNMLRTRRLKQLVAIRAKATALELLIREKNTELGNLDRANAVHSAALKAADDITHEQNKIDIRKEEAEEVRTAATVALERLERDRIAELKASAPRK
jgi:hypothetical protein